jgi:Protein of unknown function (DUF3800)
MIGTAYLDDSADGNESQVFVAAGFFCIDEEWKRLRREWRKILRPHNIPYFRTTDWRNLTGGFAGLKDKWKQDRARVIADKVKEQLESLLETSELLGGFALGINLPDFYEVDSMPEARANKKWMRECHDFKTHAFRHVFYQLAHLVGYKLDGDNYVTLICDDSNHYRKIRRGFDRMKIKFPHLADRMLSLAPMDDKTVPQLQMADLLADVTREMTTRHIATQGAEAEPLNIKSKVINVNSWSKPQMLKLLRGEYHGV